MYQSQATKDKFKVKNVEHFKIENLVLKILPFVPCGIQYKSKQLLTLKATLEFEPVLSALCDYNKIQFHNKSNNVHELKGSIQTRKMIDLQFFTDRYQFVVGKFSLT